MSTLIATPLTTLSTMRGWPARRWATATVSFALCVAVVAIPTDLVDTPWFSRDVPPQWWSWPALVTSAALGALLVATYVAPRGARRAEPDETLSRRGGVAGGALTFFAVGCPVCNKLVLLALGTAGALRWFEPVQPLLQVAAVAVLLWALGRRLRGEVTCPAPGPLPRQIEEIS